MRHWHPRRARHSEPVSDILQRSRTEHHLRLVESHPGRLDQLDRAVLPEYAQVLQARRHGKTVIAEPTCFPIRGCYMWFGVQFEVSDLTNPWRLSEQHLHHSSANISEFQHRDVVVSGLLHSDCLASD